jgi:hypothetical protein
MHNFTPLQRNRFLLLPWIIWTGVTVSLCLVCIGLSLTPILTGDLLVIVLFSWAELCVVSHYQGRKLPNSPNPEDMQIIFVFNFFPTHMSMGCFKTCNNLVNAPYTEPSRRRQ